LEVKALEKLKRNHGLSNGDKIVITHGDGQYFKPGTSNSVRVEVIKDIVPERRNELIQEVSIERANILLDSQICASCQNCVETCPYDIWKVKDDNMRETYIDASQANQCALDLKCVDNCPTGAIEFLVKKS
jgi:pyruvate kinase